MASTSLSQLMGMGTLSVKFRAFRGVLAFAEARLILGVVGTWLVGEPGFEPGTSSSRTKRATGLRHSPIGNMNYMLQNETVGIPGMVYFGA